MLPDLPLQEDIKSPALTLQGRELMFSSSPLAVVRSPEGANPSLYSEQIRYKELTETDKDIVQAFFDDVYYVKSFTRTLCLKKSTSQPIDMVYTAKIIADSFEISKVKFFQRWAISFTILESKE